MFYLRNLNTTTNMYLFMRVYINVYFYRDRDMITYIYLFSSYLGTRIKQG